MKHLIHIFLLLCISITLYSQPINKANYETMLLTAEECMAKKDYYNAVDWYQKAFEEKDDPALIEKIADLHYYLRDYQKAERWYVRMLRRDETNQFIAKRYPYARSLKMNGNYEESVKEFQKYLPFAPNDSMRTLVNNEITGAELALSLGKSTQGVVIDNAGRNVNGPASEYSPAFSREGAMYFIALNSKEVIFVDEKAKDYHARIFKSEKDDNGWEKPKALDAKVNRPDVHTIGVSFSKDGRTMFLTRAVLQGNVVANSKLYYAVGEDGNWGNVQEVKGVNGNYNIKNAVVGELFNNDVLFFSSDMPGGYGGYDLYYATRKEEGMYADPVNLGKTINSVGDEKTPFYREGTLYYSSNGLPTIGGHDIFFSVWNGSEWASPKNMGSAYNSSLDDMFFNLSEDGYSGFLTSNREEGGGRSLHAKTCCEDIYYFSIAKLFADLVAGVFDEGRKPLTGASVQLVQFKGNRSGKADSKTSEKGNRFDFPLELEMPYMLIASKDGYFPDTLQFNTLGLKESKTFEQRFYLKAMPKAVVPDEPEFDTISIEEAIVLENILYLLDDDKILPQAEPDLQVVYDLMIQHPDMVIELRSHTDTRGKDDYNIDLSQRRAESARRWLMRKGIPRTRIEVKGYGETIPQTVSARLAQQNPFLKEGQVLTDAVINALPTETEREAAHFINRRTEFKIIAGPTSITIKRASLKKK